MQIYCRQCGAPIKSNNINLDNLMAKCDECNAVFSFADMYDDVSSKKEKRDQVLMDIPMPDGINIDNSGSRLLIRRNWFHWSMLFLGGFAVVWNGMIWGFFIPNFSRFDDAPTFFMVPFVLVGVYLIVHVVSSLVNHTDIEVDVQAVQIAHKPIPFPGRYIDCANIDQLYTKRNVHRGENSTTYTYSLHVVTADGKNQKLIGNLQNSDQALFIEQEIERFLGIENRPVRGEMR